MSNGDQAAIAASLSNIDTCLQLLVEGWCPVPSATFNGYIPPALADLGVALGADLDILNLTLTGQPADAMPPPGGFVGAGVQAAADGILTNLRNDLGGMGGKVEQIVGGAIGWAMGLATGVGQTISKPLLDQVWPWILARAAEGPASPSVALTRAQAAAGFETGMGIFAHGLSMLLSVDVLGSLDLNATGLAGMIAEFAGFGNFSGAIQGPFFDAYLRTPWTYYVNEKLRPELPGVGDLLRFRSKRLFGNEKWSELGGDFFRTYMAYQGFSDSWIDCYENDLYTEPPYRQLLIMQDDPAAADDDAWLRTKVLRLGYDDQDALYMIGGLKRRLTSYYDGRLIDLWLDRVKAGELDLGEFGDLIDSLGLPKPVRHRLLDLAGETWTFAYVKESITAAQDAYARDELTDAEFGDTLDALSLRPQQIDHLVRRARLGRLHKVYVTRPIDEAVKSGGVYRTAYVAGLIPEVEYREVLAAAFYEDDVIAMRLVVDGAARDRTVAADLRQFQLPLYRDRLMDGRITLAQYRAVLVAMDFPAELLPDEMAWAAALVERSRIGRVEKYMIPTAEQAYIRCLIARPTLQSLYAQATRSANEITLRLTLVDALRAKWIHDQARGRETAPSDAQLLAWEEWSYVNGKVTETDLAALYQKLGKAPDYAERRLRALRPMRL